MYPQRFDQPLTANKLWASKDVPPVLTGLKPAPDTCPGNAPGVRCTLKIEKVIDLSVLINLHYNSCNYR
jgi:hypothetical protein